MEKKNLSQQTMERLYNTIVAEKRMQPGDKLLLRFARGGANCTVQQTWKGED